MSCTRADYAATIAGILKSAPTKDITRLTDTIQTVLDQMRADVTEQVRTVVAEELRKGGGESKLGLMSPPPPSGARRDGQGGRNNRSAMSDEEIERYLMQTNTIFQKNEATRQASLYSADDYLDSDEGDGWGELLDIRKRDTLG